MKIPFKNLSNIYFDVTDISALNQKWTSNARFAMNRPRPTDALLYLCDCDIIFSYKDCDHAITVKKGSLCFIPHGSTYTLQFLNGINNVDFPRILFEFLLRGENGDILELSDRVIVMESSKIKLCNHLFSTLVTETSRPQLSVPRTKAAALSLIAAFSEALHEDYVSQKNFGCIYPGIRYLEDDSRQEKSIAEIAEMCHVSVNYFERLFKAYSGMTPARYRLLKKTELAKVMLRMPLLSVEQIAKELNFNDSAYFCRCFKKFTGMTPTEYRTGS